MFLNGLVAALACPDSNGILDWADEYLAIADATGLGGLLDGFNGTFHHLVIQDDFDLHLGKKIHDIFSAAVELGMTLLAAKALGFDNRQTLDTEVAERFLNLIQFEGLDDRKKRNLLALQRKYAEDGVQSIITAIDSDIPADNKNNFFHKDEIVLTLHDKSDDGRLFKGEAW